jgi:hypothetical protein
MQDLMPAVHKASQRLNLLFEGFLEEKVEELRAK